MVELVQLRILVLVQVNGVVRHVPMRFAPTVAMEGVPALHLVIVPVTSLPFGKVTIAEYVRFITLPALFFFI